MPPTLTIYDDAGNETLKARIPQEIDASGVISILKAIADLPAPKKKRSDAGKKRDPKTVTT